MRIYGKFSTKFTYYVTPKNVKDKRLHNHPTIKPLDIIQNLVVNSSQEDDIILDHFLGSGTTAVACLNTNRKFIRIELDNTYFEVAKKRIEEVRSKT